MNDKLFYRFVEFLGKLNDYDVLHENYKLIALNKVTSSTKEEKKVKRIADTFRYLINSTNQVIDIDIFETSYYLLTNLILDKEISFNLLSLYYKNKDSMIHKKALILHNEILNSDLKQKCEYAIIIASFILILNNYAPIIIYDVDKQTYLNAIKENNEIILYNLFIELEHQTGYTLGNEDYIKYKTNITEVIKVIRENTYVLQNDYFVEHMYLYGSIVKGFTTIISDVDFLVVLRTEFLVFERNELIKKIKAFLELKIEASIDVMEFDYVLQQLEIVEINRTKQLF